MLEAGREGDDSVRTTVRLQLDADDAPAEAVAVLLAPLGDEEAAPVSPREALAGIEGESVSRSVRLEISCRRRDPAAAAGKAQGARVCPTVRPPVARATLDEDERVRRLGIAATAELVLTVDGRVETTRSWLDSEPVRISEPRRVDAQITSVGTQRENCGAAPIALAADVAGRAAAQVEPAVGAVRHRGRVRQVPCKGLQPEPRRRGRGNGT